MDIKVHRHTSVKITMEEAEAELAARALLKATGTYVSLDHAMKVQAKALAEKIFKALDK